MTTFDEFKTKYVAIVEYCYTKMFDVYSSNECGQRVCDEDAKERVMTKVHDEFYRLFESLSYGEKIEYYALSLSFKERYIRCDEFLNEEQLLASRIML